MTLAAVHVDPRLTVTAALVAAGLLVAYWLRLGRAAVPPARRRVRRVSIVLMFVTMPGLVRGLSFVDPALTPREYVVTWSVALIMVLLTLFTALLDGLVTFRRLRSVERRELDDAAASLARAVRDELRGRDPERGEP